MTHGTFDIKICYKIIHLPRLSNNCRPQFNDLHWNFFLPVRELFFDHVKHHKEIEASGDKNLLSADISYVNILVLIFFLWGVKYLFT
jgi:hypothetical protein